MTKKNILKKVLAVSLAAMLTLGSIPLSGLSGISLPSIFSFSASAAEEEKIYNGLKISGNTVTGFTADVDANLIIPEEVDGVAITAIGDNAFYGCTKLETVTIPWCIESIGNSAFNNCAKLSEVNFNAINCEKMPTDSATSNSAFMNCGNLKTFRFGKDVVVIPANVCWNVESLETVEFTETITSIGDNAFNGCSSLGSIVLNGVKTIGNSAFSGCSAFYSLELPETLQTIGGNAFNGCSNISTFTIPQNVTSIGDSAFNNCAKLYEVNFNAVNCSKMPADGATSNSAFMNCSNLSTFRFGKDVVVIPANVCWNVESLETVEFTETITSIGNNAFNGCSSLGSIVLNGVKTIGNSAFSGCSAFYSLELPETLQTIGGYAFYGCSNISTITIPQNVTSIGDSAFNKCSSLSEINFNAIKCETMPADGATSNSAFMDCSNLRTFRFGKNVVVIPANVCWNVTNLTTVEFTEAITSIGNNAFNGCTNFANIRYGGSEPEWNKLTADNVKAGNDPILSDSVNLTFGIIVKQNEKYGVTATFGNNTFAISDINFAVNPNAAKHDPGKKETVNGKIHEQIGCYNINIESGITEEPIDPVNGTVKLEIAIPAGNKNILIHVKNNDGETKDYSTAAGTIQITADDSKITLDVEKLGVFEIIRISKINSSIAVKNLSNKTEFFTGDTIDLSAAASDAPAGAEIIWTVDGKSAGNGTSFSYTFSKTGTAEIVAVLVDSNGNTLVEDSVTVTVNGHEEKEYHFSDSESLYVSVSYDHDCFGDEKVELKIDKAAGVRDEHDFNIPDDLIKKQVGLFDIRMCIQNTDNEATIADGKNVKVRMEVPERYKNLADFRIVHYMKNNVREVFTNSSVIDEANNERPLAIIQENGKIYLEFSVTEFSDFELFVLEPETFPAVSIVNKDKVKTINYGETLHLTAKTTDMPADAKLFWYVDGVYKDSGTTFDLSFKKGSVTVSVKLVDANGNDYYEGAEISDSQSVTVKAGFLQKLINFFKTLFGLNRTVIQTSGFYY